MDRGPAALFGAIVAVGLGPAMWLGVRLGAADVPPPRAPAVVGEHTAGPEQLVGGSGAGDSPLGADPTVRATPRAKVLRLTTSASPTPSSAKSTSPSPTATSASSSASPSSTEATTEPTTPPTETTTEPTTPPTESTTDPTLPPDPPTGTGPGGGSTTDSDELQTGTGGIAAGGPVNHRGN
jgi:hypothetical protein